MMQKINAVLKSLEVVEMQYKPIPFWSWNGELEKEELINQIRGCGKPKTAASLCTPVAA